MAKTVYDTDHVNILCDDMDIGIYFSNPDYMMYDNYLEILSELFRYETMYDSFTWENAPENAIAWAMDEDGIARWFEDDDLVINERFKDWMNDKSKSVHSLGIAPSFGFDEKHWRLSLRKRHIDYKFKINIEVCDAP